MKVESNTGGAKVEQCTRHSEFERTIGKLLATVEQQSEQVELIFEKLDGIKTSVDQNAVRTAARDEAVQEINHKIENGLRSELRECKTAIEKFAGCMERRKKEREEGVEGFFVKGFRKIHDNGGLIVILVIGWLLVGILVRMKVFGDTPEGLLKFLGLM